MSAKQESKMTAWVFIFLGTSLETVDQISVEVFILNTNSTFDFGDMLGIGDMLNENVSTLPKYFCCSFHKKHN